MVQQKNIQKLLNKPMDRRQFLAHVGAGLLIITGFSGLIRGLLDFGGGQHHHTVIHGFGSSPYGGNKK
ncbi:MAG TPA: hypothetical protein VLF39_04650 [Candidatus Saccharimonadales bacterium]|nr:hypothetical protein [Candidatus Saccharimonadales bacterium]